MYLKTIRELSPWQKQNYLEWHQDQNNIKFSFLKIDSKQQLAMAIIVEIFHGSYHLICFLSRWLINASDKTISLLNLAGQPIFMIKSVSM